MSKSFNITGLQDLGIAKVEDVQSPYYGRKPIPPILDAQMDQIWMRKMNKIKQIALRELKALIMAKSKRRKHWYMIFLTILVLLSNLELIYQNQYRQGKRYQTSVSCAITSVECLCLSD